MEIRLLLPKLEEKFISMSLKVPLLLSYLFQSIFIVFLPLFTFINHETGDDPCKQVANRWTQTLIFELFDGFSMC